VPNMSGRALVLPLVKLSEENGDVKIKVFSPQRIDENVSCPKNQIQKKTCVNDFQS
jgi:hypothetical protein